SVDLHGLAPGTYTPHRTAADIARDPTLVELGRRQVVDNIRRAEREGYDAAAITIVQNIGLREARAAVDIPVASYGEAAMHVACMVGERFSVVAFDRAIADIIEREIAQLGLATRAAPVEVVDTDYGGVVEAFARPERLIDAFTKAARRAIDRGADAIIPGQTIMAEVLWQHGIHRLGTVPIVDAVGVTIAMAALFATLRRAGD
ncbi:MAG TPA: aspartate/glutamate racemase family protein, partial [Candidatus Limnocylindria bacterium]|nr:aspartate/glutamate racemase family protein [Candidatus Limnocylindria bacterium]